MTIRDLIAFLMGMMLMVAADAIRSARGAEGDWIPQGQYRSRDGILCCHPFRDCQPVTPAVTPQGYVLDNGEVVPFGQVYPSEDRKHWLCTKPDGTRRCLFAPVGGS